MTGFAFRGNGNFVAATPLPTLASFIGSVPASINQFNWTGHDGKQSNGSYTDFSPGNVNIAGSQFWIVTDEANQTGASITTINSQGFDGTPIYFKLVENTFNGNHNVRSNVNLMDRLQYHPIPFRIMVIAAAAERTRIVLEWLQFSPTDAQAILDVGFDLAGGNTGYDVTSGTHMSVLGQSMISLGTVGGVHWWACIVDWTWNTAVTGTGRGNNNNDMHFRILLDAGSGTGARNISYAGTPGSGAYLFLAHMLPKALWTRAWAQNFLDDFASLSTIDVNNTKAPGFNWYVDGDFGASSSPAGFWHPKPVTTGDSFSQPMPSVLQHQATAAYPDNNNFHASLQSVTRIAGSGLASIRGTYWAPPMIVDGYYTFEGALFSSEQGYLNNINIFWLVSPETLAGSPLDGSGHYLEWDVGETAPSTAGTPANTAPSNHFYWNGSATPETEAGGGAGAVLPNFALTQFHRVTGVWLDAASGASGATGWGLFLEFFDGQAYDHSPLRNNPSGVVYQTAGVTHPLFSGTDAVGAFSAADTAHQMMFLWGTSSHSIAFGVKTWWDWVRVWQ
jgi:hypothetical protein